MAKTETKVDTEREERRAAANERRFTVPKGRRPEEFLDDEGLAEFYKRKAQALKPDDPERAEAIQQAVRAESGAAAARLARELSEGG